MRNRTESGAAAPAWVGFRRSSIGRAALIQVAFSKLRASPYAPGSVTFVCVCVTVGRAFGDDMMFSVALDCFPLPIQVALVCIHVFQLVRLDWITDHWSAFAVRQPAVRGPSTTPTLAALLVHLEHFWLIFAPCWHPFGGCGFIIGTLMLVSGR